MSSPAGRVMRRSLRGERKRLVGSAALLMLWQACESLVPVTIGVIVDSAITPRELGALIRWLIVLGVLFAVLSLSFRFGSRLGRSAAERAAHTLRVELTASVLDPLAVTDPAARTGDTASRVGNDTERVARMFISLPSVAGALTSIVVAAVVMLRIDLRLGLLVLLGAPVLLVLIRLLGRPLERRAGLEQAAVAEASAVASDLVSGLRVLAGLRAGNAAQERYRRASAANLSAAVRAARADGLFSGTTMLLTLVFLALVTLVAGRLAASGSIEIGDLIAAVGVAQFLLGPFSVLTSAGSNLARARASAGRLAETFAAPRHPAPSSPVPAPTHGAVRLSLTGGTLEASAGTLVGVLAEPAEAARLVEALSEPRAHDRLLVDGSSPHDWDASAAARTIVVAPHDGALFARSLVHNVAAGRPDAGRIARAMAATAADEVASTLPDGGATQLGEAARTLSGGQRQRVALARALAADPVVLVLHDPTTALDPVTEARAADGIRALRRGRTTLLFTSSPALLAVCDVVVHVRDGAVHASGPHAELAERDEAYRRLVLT